MKKILLTMMMLAIVVILSGCYNYSQGSQYGKLIAINFYTEDYDEIVGNYYNRFNDEYVYESDNISVTLNYPQQPMNSPAPNELYYKANVNVGDTIIVRFTIKQNYDYEFHSVHIDYKHYYVDDAHHFEVVDNYAYFDILIEDIQTDKTSYDIRYIQMKKEIDGVLRIVRGSIWVEGRTYISGFAFIINEEE